MVEPSDLHRTVVACRDLIESRFPVGGHRGAAAMLLDDGSVLTGTSPEAINPGVQVCHEIEPYTAAYRLDRGIVASVCLHRTPERRFLVLSPCGVCRERLATHGSGVLVAVADRTDPTLPRWITLGQALPDYWMTVFPDELTGWDASF